MKTFVLLLFLLGTGLVRGQGVPLFTADYYRTNPEAYLGKSVTLAVAYVKIRSEEPEDGMRELQAYTYNQGAWGGFLFIRTPATAVPRLITLCGTSIKLAGGAVHFTLIHGTFLEDEGNKGRYYVLVK